MFSLGSRVSRLGLCLATLIGLQACDRLAGNDLPPGIPHPDIIKNENGARGMAVVVQRNFQQAFGATIRIVGLLTDELQSVERGGTASTLNAKEDLLIDSRHLASDMKLFGPYRALHQVRGSASQAITALTEYAPNTSANLRGALYAYAGYAEVYLADLYCSGIPLSTLDFNGDWTIKPGSSTRDVYAHAVALFDSAIALTADSTEIGQWARIGKARALLALGEYQVIDTVLRDIDETFMHTEPLLVCDAAGTTCPAAAGGYLHLLYTSVANREGGRNIIYPENPRTGGIEVQVVVPVPNYFPVYHPDQYPKNDVSTIPVASAREAALIRAEVAIHNNDPDLALNILNTLRANDPRTSSFPPIEMPPTMDELIDTLFAERGQWLFLTAHRQGDLRRLVRNYNRPQQTVYPSGAYPGGIVAYGSEVTLPISSDEEGANPYFNGCFDRRA
jgi:hypothetical protein